MSERLATSIGKTQPHSITFEVSDAVLDEDHWLSLTMRGEDGWSPPVRFRFEKHEYDEQWDLVMQRVDEVPA